MATVGASGAVTFQLIANIPPECRCMSDPSSWPPLKNFFSHREYQPACWSLPHIGCFSRHGRTGRSQLPANKRSHHMTYLRTAFLATTAVGLMALATPAFAEVITTPDGHYYKLVPLK